MVLFSKENKIWYFFSRFPGNCSTDAVLETFNKLVNARFVERCPAPEPFLEPPAEDETPAKKRGAKTAKVVTLHDTCYKYFFRQKVEGFY